MNKNNSIVAASPSHTVTEAAIKSLQQSGFEMKKLVKKWSHRAAIGT